MTLLVDDRAGSKDLMAHACIRDIGSLTRLESADVAFTGNGPDDSLLIGIELKSISDLVSSIGTGRLPASQVPAMLDTYDVSYLLHYGSYRADPISGVLQVAHRGRWLDHRVGSRSVPYGWLMSMLTTFMGAGMRIVRVTDLTEAAAWIAAQYRWWQKPWSDHRGLHTFDKSTHIGLRPDIDSDTLLRARVAAQLPGVGYDRAIQVARHFTSVRDMMCAGSKRWAEIPGIGRVIADGVEITISSVRPTIVMKKRKVVREKKLAQKAARKAARKAGGGPAASTKKKAGTNVNAGLMSRVLSTPRGKGVK